MNRIEKSLELEGYTVHNLGYESRHHSIEKIAEDVRQRIIEETECATQIHFVTHSMGGILVRQIQATDPIDNIGRVVMLSPPNQGSEVTDKIGHWWLYKKINGPAGQQLGTDKKGFIAELGPINFDCAVITGDHSINWINSLMIPGKDDGKVSVKSSYIEGVTTHKVVHAAHPTIMIRQSVTDHIIHFIETGEI
jgi:pimeloyl-ACP methyl ester carboxylesterase